MGSAAALKCNDCKLESWLAGRIEKGSVHWRERPGMSMRGVVYSGRVCTEWVNVHWRVQIFLFIVLDQSEMTKSHMCNTSFKLTNHKYFTAE